MREFLQAINDYPWTSFFLVLVILAILDMVVDIFKFRK